MTPEEQLKKIDQASELLFEVETFRRNHVQSCFWSLFHARDHIGHVRHELLIETGVRKRAK